MAPGLSRVKMDLNFTVFKQSFSLFFSSKLLKDPTVRTRGMIAILLVLIDIAVVSLIPYCTKQIVDALSINLLNSVWIALFFLSIFWILDKILSHIQDIILFPVINRMIRGITHAVVDHIHQIPLTDYKKLSISEVINCIRRISLSARAFIKILLLLIIPTTFKLLIAVMITIKAGLFGWLLVPGILISLMLLYKGTQWYIAARGSAWQASDMVTLSIHDSLLNTKIVRPFHAFEMEKINSILSTEANLWNTTNIRLHSIYIFIGILLGTTLGAVLIGVIQAIHNQTLTIGDFVFLKGQLIAAFLPLRAFSMEFRQLAESMVDIKKILSIFEIPLEENIKKPSTLVKAPENAIEVENASFSYDAQKSIFSHLSLSIKKGEKIAIIGKNGSGKSALINLLANIYKPLVGSLYINGQPIENLTPNTLSALIHFIPQDFRLFNKSLRYNMTYGMRGVSNDALLQVAKDVDLLDTIEHMEKGFDTLVGEMGTKLSGGEKQKVALARALLLKPEILLLDETTSSLNNESEKKILKVLFSSIPTVILTSHKTSILGCVHKILKMQDGTLHVAIPPVLDTDPTAFIHGI